MGQPQQNRLALGTTSIAATAMHMLCSTGCIVSHYGESCAEMPAEQEASGIFSASTWVDSPRVFVHWGFTGRSVASEAGGFWHIQCQRLGG